MRSPSRLSFGSRKRLAFTVFISFYIISEVSGNLFHFGNEEEERNALAVSEKAREEYMKDEIAPLTYGVDVSFPMHKARVSENYPWLEHNNDVSIPIPEEHHGREIQPLGNRQQFYEDFMDGCRKYYGKSGGACDQVERDRIAMSLRQPQSMTNYTDNGFKKIKTPAPLWKLLDKFWNDNKDKMDAEHWFTGNTYTNSWEAPTQMVSVENTRLRGAGGALKQQIWNAAKDTLQEWTGQELTPCSLYGIRVYKDGAVLATHVDRLPLVSSAIINVGQDVDEPWPLEVIGHDRVAHNVTMEPGDMVLYESHSVLHGRPFPLKGRYYANIFVHFEPTGHSLRHYEEHVHDGDVDKKYRNAIESKHGGHENSEEGLPTYLKPNTPEEKHWKQSHPGYKRPKEQRKSAIQRKMDTFATGSTLAHAAAQEGDVKTMMKVIKEDESQIHQADNNGWTPLHEAARGGHTEVVKILVKHKVDKDARTNNGDGGSALWLAESLHGEDHPVVTFLKKVGALSIGPEL